MLGPQRKVIIPKSFYFTETLIVTVVDTGFPRVGGANSKYGGTNLLFWPVFPKNCMKMIKIEPRVEGRCSWHVPLGLLESWWNPQSNMMSRYWCDVTYRLMTSLLNKLVDWSNYHKTANMFLRNACTLSFND